MLPETPETSALNQLLLAVHHLSKSSQLAISTAVVILALLLHRAVSHGIMRRAHSVAAARTLVIRVRTGLTMAVAVCLVTLWSTELKSAILTLAALGAATIIAIKEMIACWLGSAYRATASTFDLGDVVEVAGVRGEVVDVGAVSFTLMELGPGFQETGRVVEMPNAILFSSPVRNLSSSGPFVIHFTRVPVASEDPVLARRAVLLDAVEAACASFQAAAAASLALASRRLLANAPSTAPSVAIELRDAKSVDLVLRYPCPRNERMRTEQDILTRYFAQCSAPAASVNTQA